MEDKKQKLVSLVREAAQPPKKRRAAPRKLAQSVRIDGSHNIVGDGNTVIHAHAVRQINRIDPTKGELTEAQKSKLTELLNAWISAHNTIRVRAKPLTHAAAWSSFKRKFQVTSYHYLPSARYEEALQWLMQKRAQIDGMKTAPMRDPAWRARQIAYIKARCKNQLGDERCYQPYIERTFGKTSLSDLDEAELARTKSYIAHKKAP
ncbi:ORF6C domain-containing protein [Tepidicella xavieri]|uniref:ORF6C domain-containing protein n=1 Tax=Tepidicella xavieri TaxID=360241 RepID=A0A4R6U897_9BURK|nr:ORF6C domain-containing protein [Tepidicella xavieri]TDQ40999.1 ORF6C domain-containing protein [Tepidicella xavieri]